NEPQVLLNRGVFQHSGDLDHPAAAAAVIVRSRRWRGWVVRPMRRMIDGIEMRSEQRDRTRATSEPSFIGDDIRGVATWHPHVLKTDLISHRLQLVPHFSRGILKVAGQRVARWMRCQLNQCRCKTVSANGVYDTLDPFIDTRCSCRARQCLKDDLIFFCGTH